MSIFLLLSFRRCMDIWHLNGQHRTYVNGWLQRNKLSMKFHSFNPFIGKYWTECRFPSVKTSTNFRTEHYAKQHQQRQHRWQRRRQHREQAIPFDAMFTTCGSRRTKTTNHCKIRMWTSPSNGIVFTERSTEDHSSFAACKYVLYLYFVHTYIQHCPHHTSHWQPVA